MAALTRRGTGTSKNTRQAAQRETAGTTHTLAPEALLAMDGADSRVPEADLELNYRAIDVYAFGILLCALWDTEEDQLRHIRPLLTGPEPLTDHDKYQQAFQAFKKYVNDTVTYEPHGLRPDIPPVEAVDAKNGMPELYVKLMQECWHFDPEKRPSFSAICKRMKDEIRRTASTVTTTASASSVSEQVRVVLHVSYNPKVVYGQKQCVFTLNTTVESNSAPMTLADGVDGDVTTYAFPFAVCAGESVSLHLTHSLYTGDTPGSDVSWVPDVVCADLLTNIQASAAPQVLPQREIALEPAWDAPGAQIPEAGKPVGLIIKVTRTPAPVAADPKPKPVNLGVLQLEMQSKVGVARANSGGRLMRMPSSLRAENQWKQDRQVFISYREQETGIKGSNFAFRLQEALESAGYTVFCYGALRKTGNYRWISPFVDGVQTCQAFIPICSPEYGDLDLAPWTAAELLQARERNQRSMNDQPAIIPIRHHGKYPPSPGLGLEDFDCVPDKYEYVKTPEARRMKLDDVWQLVVARLEDAGVHPKNKQLETQQEEMQQ